MSEFLPLPDSEPFSPGIVYTPGFISMLGHLLPNQLKEIVAQAIGKHPFDISAEEVSQFLTDANRSEKVSRLEQQFSQSPSNLAENQDS